MYRSNFRKLAELAKKTPDELIEMIGEGSVEKGLPEWVKRFKTYEEAARELRRYFPESIPPPFCSSLPTDPFDTPSLAASSS